MVVVALAIAFFVFLTYVIPQFAVIFQSAGIDLPLPTRVAIGEETGNLDDLLREISIHYDDEVSYAV